MSEDLQNKIIRQIEYYFGDINLPRDKFMQEKVKEDEGWITLDTLLTFKRLASLTTDPEVIAKAIEKSELVEVSEDKKKLRRNPELILPELNDERRKELMSRTAYAKGFGMDTELNDVINFLEPYGPIESCSRRLTKDHKFKGSCFIIFKDIETCKKFVETESIKFKDTELIRKWQNDYLVNKKKEYEERKKLIQQKKEQKKEQQQKNVKTIEYPKGAIIHFCGIPEGESLVREQIKEKINEFNGFTVCYIDFNKGDLEGYVRLSAENAAVEFMKKIEGGELEVGGFKLKLRALEGEEEDAFLKKAIEAVTKMRQRPKFGKNSRKRKGNFNNGREAKAQKTA